jgi:hypothetical protein
MRNIVIIVLIFATAFVSACSKNLPDTGATSAVKVANEWWVQLDDGSGPGDVVKIATYNTASNPDSIWIDDLGGNVWDMKFKAKVDLNALTFASQNVQNQAYNIKITVTDGKILSKAAKSKSGNVTDSIYMQIEFSDDPGTKYKLAGHARTEFSEDEY